MPIKVIFLYRSFPDKIYELLQTNQAGVYALPETRLVGLEVTHLSKWKRQELVSSFALREFEVEQQKFSQIIKSVPSLKARLTNVKISRSSLYPDLEADLAEAVMHQKLEKVVDLIAEFSDLGHDVQSVEYILNNERIGFTRLAELDVDSHNPDIYSLLNTTPVAFLSGVVREDELQ